MKKAVFCFLTMHIFTSLTMINDGINIPEMTTAVIDFYKEYIGEDNDIPVIKYNILEWKIVYFISQDNHNRLEDFLTKNNLLQSLNCPIFNNNLKVTMLHVAAFYNSINIIGWLVKNKANLKPSDHEEQTPHNIAVKFKKYNAVRIIEGAIQLDLNKNVYKTKKRTCTIL